MPCSRRLRKPSGVAIQRFYAPLSIKKQTLRAYLAIKSDPSNSAAGRVWACRIPLPVTPQDLVKHIDITRLF
jgi:hypothetical protein